MRPVKNTGLIYICLSTACILGINTLSMAWQTPLSTSKSNLIMFAPLTFMWLCKCHMLKSIRSSPPESACKYSCWAKSDAMSFPSTTWKVKISFNLAVSFRSLSRPSLGILLNASSVGAKTVNGPGAFSVSTSPAAFYCSYKCTKHTRKHCSVNNIRQNFTSTTVKFP